MKKTIILFFLLAIFFRVNGQEKLEDFKSGKYFKNTGTKQFLGIWTGNIEGNEIKLLISSKKTRFKTINSNFETDALFIQLKKYFHINEDYALYFSEPLKLVGTSNSKQFFGINKDVVTNNYIDVSLIYNDNNTIKMEVKVPTGFDNLPEKGTIFYSNILLTKSKKD